MEQISVFLDTDVIISALLSKTGASIAIIKNSQVEKIISNAVKKEVEEVVKRLKIVSPQSRFLKNINIVSLKLTKSALLKKYKDYVFDEKDAHVVAGTHRSKAKFLLTHNFKHYKTEKIHASFGIIVSKPGNLLQYLRCLGKF